MQQTSKSQTIVRTKVASATLVKTVVATLGVLSIGSLLGSGAHAATTSKPTAKVGEAFCRQVTASQTAIAKAVGTPKAKLTAIGAEWTKIAATAPGDVKANVLVVRTAYVEAAKAGVDTATKAPAVSAAGQQIAAYFTQNCGGAGLAGAGGQGGRDGGGPGGPDNPERTAYRECLAKNGATLPAPGQRGGNAGPANAPVAKAAAGAKPAATVKPAAGAAAGGGTPGNGGGRRGGFGLDPNDPVAAKAMKACESLLPAGGFGGGRGGGGFGNPAMQACLTKKGVTIARPAGGGAGGAGGGGGARPVLDAKTQAALDACQKEVGTNG